MLKEDENTKLKDEFWQTGKTSITSWINYTREYRGCKIHIEQYDIDWSFTRRKFQYSWDDPRDLIIVNIPKGYCNIRVVCPGGVAGGSESYIPEDMINRCADEIIDRWLQMEKPYVEYLDAICVDSSVGKPRPEGGYFPDDPNTWASHDDAELKNSKIPDMFLKQVVENFEMATSGRPLQDLWGY